MKANRVVRYASALPVGVFAAAIAMLPVHWLVMMAFGGWGVDPIIEIKDLGVLRSIESGLQAVVGPFILLAVAGYVMPPPHRIRVVVTISLGLLIVFGVPLLVYTLNASAASLESGTHIQYGYGRVAANVIGVIASVWLINTNKFRLRN